MSRYKTNLEVLIAHKENPKGNKRALDLFNSLQYDLANYFEIDNPNFSFYNFKEACNRNNNADPPIS